MNCEIGNRQNNDRSGQKSDRTYLWSSMPIQVN